MIPRAWDWASTFASLRNRDFRWLWVGRLVSSATMPMGMVARGWLVYDITGSAFALSLVDCGMSISMLIFALYGGALCDRVEKRNLLFWMRVGMTLNTIALAILIAGGIVNVWVLLANSLLSGIFFSFMMPAEQAITVELVDRPTLLNAVALNSIGMGAMGIVGSPLAGYIIEFAGVAGVYYLMAFLLLLGALSVTKLPATGRRGSGGGTLWAGLVDGLGHIRRSPVLLTLLGLSLARVLFTMPYRTLMPKFAVDVMGFDAAGLGILMAAPGIGSLAASLGMASLGDFHNKGKLLLASGIVLSSCLILFASFPYFSLILLFLALVGAASNICMVTNNTLLQVSTEDAYRGRVNSMGMLTFGLGPLGTLPAGALADGIGVPLVIALEGALSLLVFFAVLFSRKDLRRLE